MRISQHRFSSIAVVSGYLFRLASLHLADKDILIRVSSRTERAHIHEVQMMELALRRSDYDREWLAGFDQCIAQDSSLDVNVLIPDGPGGNKEFDERVLHLPVLCKKYQDQLFANRNGVGGSFWVANIREATRKRLAVSCGRRCRHDL
jgi:hypothetical protein